MDEARQHPDRDGFRPADAPSETTEAASDGQVAGSEHQGLRDASDREWSGSGPSGSGPAVPEGEVYDWYQRALGLLETGSAGAAASLLEHALVREPESASVREALARALFDSKRFLESSRLFGELAASNPDDDYAQFGLGLSLSRLGDFSQAVEHLALAVAMRPQRAEYVSALHQARATLRARSDQP